MNERTWRIHGVVGIKPAFRAAYDQVESLMRQVQGGYELVLRPLKSKRSIDQNKRYWALLRELAAVAWVDGKRYSDDVWHEQFKQWFIGSEEVAMPDGTTRLQGISTTKLSVQEFGDYMARIEHWAAEQGWPVMLEAA